jgi:DNA-binding transcriptional MerR regulator
VQQRLQYARLARKMGLSVADISGVKKSLAGDRSTFCQEVRKIVEQRLAAIESKIAQLERARTELSHWLEACRTRSASFDCPLYRELMAAMSGKSNKQLK